MNSAYHIDQNILNNLGSDEQQLPLLGMQLANKAGSSKPEKEDFFLAHQAKILRVYGLLIFKKDRPKATVKGPVADMVNDCGGLLAMFPVLY